MKSFLPIFCFLLFFQNSILFSPARRRRVHSPSSFPSSSLKKGLLCSESFVNTDDIVRSSSIASFSDSDEENESVLNLFNPEDMISYFYQHKNNFEIDDVDVLILKAVDLIMIDYLLRFGRTGTILVQRYEAMMKDHHKTDNHSVPVFLKSIALTKYLSGFSKDEILSFSKQVIAVIDEQFESYNLFLNYLSQYKSLNKNLLPVFVFDYIKQCIKGLNLAYNLWVEYFSRVKKACSKIRIDNPTYFKCMVSLHSNYGVVLENPIGIDSNWLRHVSSDAFLSATAFPSKSTNSGFWDLFCPFATTCFLPEVEKYLAFLDDSERTDLVRDILRFALQIDKIPSELILKHLNPVGLMYLLRVDFIKRDI